MSEFLTIRFSSQLSEPVQWLVWSTSQDEVIASGELTSTEQLGDLTSYADQRPVYVLIPTSDVLLTQVEVPPGASRQLQSMLPFLLEDELAQDVDALHISLLKQEGSIAYVSVVDKSSFEGWLEACQQAGINIKKVLPDSLALPWKEKDIVTAQLGSQWLVRSGLYAGVSAEEAWLAPWLTSLLVSNSAEVMEEEEGDSDSDGNNSEAEQPQVIRSFSPAPEIPATTLPGQWQQEPPELVMQLLAKGAQLSKVNLLSGEYRPQSSWLKHWKVWQKSAVAACLVVTVLVAQHVMSIQVLEQQGKELRSESERIFRDIFPNKRKIPTVSYLKSQMRTEETRLQGGDSGSGLLNWLSELQPHLKHVPQIAINGLKYDSNRGELRIQASSDDFQPFEKMRSSLSEDFNVEQGQLNKNEGNVYGVFVLRRKS